MAKLPAQATSAAGWNAGKTFYAKTARPNDLVFDPDIAKLFIRGELVLNEIICSIKKNGFDKSQPVVVWKDGNIVVDGHTRVLAAKAVGLEEIPVVEAEFSDKEDAILYTFERQVVRRNLTASEILSAVSLIAGRKAKDGKGRAAAILAGRLGVSEAHIYQAKKVLAEAPQESVEAVKAGTVTIKEVYNQITAKPDAVKKGRVEKTPSPSVGAMRNLLDEAADKIGIAAGRLSAMTIFDKEDVDVVIETLKEAAGAVKEFRKSCLPPQHA